MAEEVQQAMEDMIPELEQMEHIGLFTRQEVKALIGRRKDFEYKLRRFKKRKEDFLAYIEAEIQLLTLLRKRRKKTGCRFKRREIDDRIMWRISKLFRMVTFRHQGDLSIWLSYIQFLMRIKNYARVSAVYIQMLAVHGDKPEVWVSAAKWEMQRSQAPDVARKILLRGLKRHPHCEDLYLAHFRMELLHVQDLLKLREEKLDSSDSDDGIDSGAVPRDPKRRAALRRRRRRRRIEAAKDTNDAVLTCGLAKVVAEEAVDVLSSLSAGRGVAVGVALLAAAKGFPFAGDLRRWLVELLGQRFPDEELTEDTLARWKLEKEAYDVGKDETVPKLGARIRNCLEAYDAAVARLNTEVMWNLYLGTAEELDAATKAKTGRDSGRYLQVSKRALAAGRLPAGHCVRLAERLEVLGDVAGAVAAIDGVVERCLQGSSKSRQDVGKLLLRKLEMLACGKTPFGDFAQQFFASLKVLDKTRADPTSNWEANAKALCYVAAVRARVQRGNESEEPEAKEQAAVAKFFEDCLNLDVKLAGEFKADYLAWRADVKGLASARKLYAKIARTPPYSRACFETMIRLEIQNREAEPSAAAARIRLLYDELVNFFGKEKRAWVAYLEWAEAGSDWELIASVKSRAAAALSGRELEDFNYYVTTKSARRERRRGGSRRRRRRRRRRRGASATGSGSDEDEDEDDDDDDDDKEEEAEGEEGDNEEEAARVMHIEDSGDDYDLASASEDGEADECFDGIDMEGD